MKRDLAGMLDRRVELLKFSTASRNARNEPVATYTSQGTFAARQISQRAMESWKAGQSAGQAETLFRLRHCAVTAAISPRDRLSCGGRTFEVIGVPTEFERGRLVDVACITVPQS